MKFPIIGAIFAGLVAAVGIDQFLTFVNSAGEFDNSCYIRVCLVVVGYIAIRGGRRQSIYDRQGNLGNLGFVCCRIDLDSRMGLRGSSSPHHRNSYLFYFL